MRVTKGKSITLRDAQQVKRFGLELRMMANLEQGGHTRGCARGQVFDGYPCTCVMRLAAAKEKK